MKIAVASGKGGVGKSMLASSLAVYLSESGFKVLACDCDVDAPNLGIWLGVKDYQKLREVETSEKAFVVNQSEVLRCGINETTCKFGAIVKVNGNVEINQLMCEGCGLCYYLCPKGIEMRNVKNGEIMLAETSYGFSLLSARLYPGESGSGKLVEELKAEASKLSYEVMVIDVPAGIGCPVVASLRGVDFVVLVAEPTLTGINDLKKVLSVVRHFGLSYGLVINKWDLNVSLSSKLEKEFGDKLIGKIRYDRRVFEVLSAMKPLITGDCKACEDVKNVVANLKENIL